MPKETFLKLPEAKRRRITDLALEEFAGHSYHQASLSRIVEAAGIAKGSIYQYFEDKFDLYLYVLGLAVERKLRYVQEDLAPLGPDPDFFAALKAACRASLRLVRDAPLLVTLSARLFQEPDRELHERVMTHFGAMGAGRLETWIRQGIDKGQVDRGVRPAAASYVTWTATSAVGQDLAAGKLSVDETAQLLEEVIDILERGLRPRDNGGGKSPT